MSATAEWRSSDPVTAKLSQDTRNNPYNYKFDKNGSEVVWGVKTDRTTWDRFYYRKNAAGDYVPYKRDQFELNTNSDWTVPLAVIAAAATFGYGTYVSMGAATTIPAGGGVAAGVSGVDSSFVAPAASSVGTSGTSAVAAAAAPVDSATSFGFGQAATFTAAPVGGSAAASAGALTASSSGGLGGIVSSVGGALGTAQQVVGGAAAVATAARGLSSGGSTPVIKQDALSVTAKRPAQVSSAGFPWWIVVAGVGGLLLLRKGKTV